MDSERHYANMQQNVERGLYFLRLATEQARILSPAVATRLEHHYIPELLQQFDQAVTTELIDAESATALVTLAREGDEAMAGLRHISTQAPLGFGGGVARERFDQEAVAPVTNPYGAIGGERKRTISQHKAPKRKNKLLADLVATSER